MHPPKAKKSIAMGRERIKLENREEDHEYRHDNHELSAAVITGTRPTQVGVYPTLRFVGERS